MMILIGIGRDARVSAVSTSFDDLFFMGKKKSFA